ncbi:MAG: ATP-dependent DNA ligase [Acidobacteria bacterium]|nr:MAG: ATP-dependent DNA ligase [Acidobacteriota bacterium]
MPEFDGVDVRLTNRDKLYWPAGSDGSLSVTKGEMLEYYESIAPIMLPHVAERAASLLRCPEGVGDECFFAKQAPEGRPEWVKTIGIWAKTSNREVDYIVVNDIATLMWAANLGAIEFHVSPARASSLGLPTYVVFDLDPGPPADAADCAEVALMIRDRLADFGLRGFAKSSGSKGVHVIVPLNSPTTFEKTETFAHRIAAQIQETSPDRVVTKMRKELRAGKVLIDWSQNQRHKTTVAPYSVRAKARPTVSAPLHWGEIEAASESGSADGLFFEIDRMAERVDELGDLMGEATELIQLLPEELTRT